MNQTPARWAICGLILSLTPLAFGAAAAGPKARLFAKYDLNKNGIIDGDEAAAVRKDFAAEPKGDLARYDADHDGKLSDAEIALIKPPGQRDKKGGGKKGGSKSEVKPVETTNPASTPSAPATPAPKPESK
jgi:hypothetical protein